MQFPNLNGDPLIDDVINKCWHNKYATIAALATYTATLLFERIPPNSSDTEAAFPPEYPTEAVKPEITNSGDSDSGDINQNCLPEVPSKRSFCESLEKRGLLDMLSSGEPEQLGFTLEWYRYHTS